MTSIMEYSGQDTVDVYITGEDADDLVPLGRLGEVETIEMYESDNEQNSKTEEITRNKSSPTVFVTELPKGIIAAHQELKIPSKSMETSELILSQLETDGKGNSIVTIQVPYLDDLMNNSDDIQTIELQISEDLAMDAISNSDKHVTVNKNGELCIGSDDKLILKQSPVQKNRQQIPIWKRHTPKPPGYISNYLYPHGLRNARSRVIIDCPTNIPVPEFKAQLADTSDIVTTLDVAPSTKKKVKELTTNSVSKLFAYPGKPFPCKKLYNLFQRHLTSKPQKHELPTDLELMPIGYSPSIDYTQVKRITRKRKQPEISPVEVEIAHQEAKSSEGDVSDSSIVQSLVPISDQVVRVLIKPGVVGEEEQEILVLHDGSETLEGSASLQHSIEVLLAAAESGELGKEPQQVEQVFICNEGTYDENVTDPFMTEQIIIVQNELDEEELCGQTIESS